MDASHIQHSMYKIVKIWCKSCLFCFKKHAIPICIMFLFFLLFMFFPKVYTFLIYSSLLVGFSFLVHRVLLGIDRQKIRRVEEDNRKKKFEEDNRKKKLEEDNRRKKFAKSRRSFKSIYGDRSQLVRRNAKEKSDYHANTNVDDLDAIFSKSLNDLLADKTAVTEEKPKEIQEMNVEPVERSPSNNFRTMTPKIYDRVNEQYRKHGNNKDELEGESWDISEDEDDKPLDKTAQNVMDLGLLETERNKRLEGLIERRRSRKNLLQDTRAVGDNDNGQISAIKIVKTNPFLEDNSCGKNTPGSAPSSLMATRNPFDLPYDPHEEKLDLRGDDFHEEFVVGHHKEPIFCRHESFSFGGFSHPEITTFDERKADIVFFYGGKKRVGHAPSNSIVSDLQVEVSDGSQSCLDDLDVEKDKGSSLNLSNLSQGGDSEVVKADGEDDNPKSLIDIKMEEHHVDPDNNPEIIPNSF